MTFLGNPAVDPPFTVRRHPDDRADARQARRVIRVFPAVKRVEWHRWPLPVIGEYPWVVITGRRGSMPCALNDEQVADWPVDHYMQYAPTFRLAATGDARARGEHEKNQPGEGSA